MEEPGQPVHFDSFPLNAVGGSGVRTYGACSSRPFSCGLDASPSPSCSGVAGSSAKSPGRMVPSARSSGARELPRSFSRSFSNIATSVSSQHCLDRLLHLAGTERQAADEVESCRVDEELGADQLAQLAEIDLRDQHLLVRAV